MNALCGTRAIDGNDVVVVDDCPQAGWDSLTIRWCYTRRALPIAMTPWPMASDGSTSGSPPVRPTVPVANPLGRSILASAGTRAGDYDRLRVAAMTGEAGLAAGTAWASH